MRRRLKPRNATRMQAATSAAAAYVHQAGGLERGSGSWASSRAPGLLEKKSAGAAAGPVLSAAWLGGVVGLLVAPFEGFTPVVTVKERLPWLARSRVLV